MSAPKGEDKSTDQKPADPKRKREGFMSDHYVDLYERVDGFTQALTDAVEEYAEDPEVKGLLGIIGSAFFLHTYAQLNIARSLERIAFALENRTD